MRTIQKSRPAPAFRYSPLVAALALALAPHANAAFDPYEVTIPDSIGPGSLRAVVDYANSNCGDIPSPTITFNIPATLGTGPFTISQSLSFSCSSADYTPKIDGYTQTATGAARNSLPNGWNANIQIILDGEAYGGCGLTWSQGSPSYGGLLTVAGLEITNFNSGLCGNIEALGNRIVANQVGVRASSSSDVALIGDGSFPNRNVIGGNTSYGVEVTYGGTATIRGNFIGTLDGVNRRANEKGIYSFLAYPSTISDNVISGNNSYGIYIANTDDPVTISSNKIGVTAVGNAALSNATGVYLSWAYGGADLTSNTISGNLSGGVVLFNSSNVTLNTNYIGTDATASFALANERGVSATCGSFLSLQSNVISGNSWDGVILFGTDGGSAGNISGNKIGVSQGLLPLGNGSSGIEIRSTLCSESGSNHRIVSNTIANNGGDGISLLSGTGNTIGPNNSIYDNGVAYGGKNININSSYGGPLPNDYLVGDADAGPNNQQNYPDITSVEDDGDGGTVVSYTLDSAPSTTFRLDFYSNPAPGAPAGRTWRASRNNENTDASGILTGSARLSGTPNNISITATHSITQDTSEFSPIGSLGLSPAVTLSATVLDFGSIVVGSTSPSDMVTVSSVGNVPYVIAKFDQLASCYGSGAFCYGGGFTCSTTCNTAPFEYSGGTSCSVTATFAPITLGLQSTTIYLCDNTTATPHSITLNGVGVVPPILSVLPSLWDFGNTLVGKQSAVKSFSVVNPGSTPATIGAISTTGDFTLVSTNCTDTVTPGISCDAVVAFKPTQAGFTTGTLVVPIPGTPMDVVVGKGVGAKVAGPSTATATLAGTGIQAASLSMPSSVTLPAFTLGGTPSSKAVELTNNGNAVLTFSSISAGAPFTVANGCPVNLAPGASCIVTVGFSSSERGTFNGTLTVVSNAPGGSRAIPITVLSQAVATPLVHVVPTFIGFGSRMIGTQSAIQRLTLTNDGGAPATLSALGVGVDYLLVNTSCGLTLEPASTCFAEVAFRPVGFGPRPGQFTFSSNSPGSPFVVEMLGSGCRPFTISNRGGATSACAP